ncbi:MAG: Uma2 family endonuclease [Vulcanimicrobiota bacterium]
MTISLEPLENRFVMTADWDTYEKILEAVGDRPVKVTYDNGRLELMSPSYDHEKGKTALGALLESILVHLDLEFDAGGSTTFKEKALQRGLEPDECYWIANASEFEGAWNSERDPYPDLAIEVEVSRSVLDRMGILAALGVREVWRLDRDGSLLCYQLGPDQTYQKSETSAILPTVRLAEVEKLVKLGQEQKLSTVLREFRRTILDVVGE